MQRRNNGLNAPSGAGCFLTDWGPLGCRSEVRLNAPSGAGCFLTVISMGFEPYENKS